MALNGKATGRKGHPSNLLGCSEGENTVHEAESKYWDWVNLKTTH